MQNVLITGGTGGIGYALARIFAQNGYHIILVSSNLKRLKAAKQKLNREFMAEVSVCQQDLSQLGGAELLYQKVKAANISIDVLVNNAGYGTLGPTEQIPLQNDQNMLILNTINLVALCKLFLPDMYQRGAGKILNVSSTGAFQPGPYTSTYFASKAFVLSYSRAIRFEAKKRGVSICTLCPGATKTEFFTKEGVKTPIYAMSAQVVAKKAYQQLMHNKAVVIPGLRNKLLNIFPDSLKMAVIAKAKD